MRAVGAAELVAVSSFSGEGSVVAGGGGGGDPWDMVCEREIKRVLAF